MDLVRNPGRSLRLLLAVILAGALFAPLARSQTLDSHLWITDGTVNTVVRSGNTVYVGGTFTRVGPNTGGGVPLDAGSSGIPGTFPKVAGSVYAVASDGAGGWFIGGQFTGVAGVPRSNVAHIAADGSVTPWNPGADAPVRALLVNGATVYAGGEFTTMGGQLRNHVAALDAATGAATSWDPNANGSVLALALDGSAVYVGGSFSSVGGQTRHNAAAIDATGAATSWAPDPNDIVSAIALSGTTVYLAGSFDGFGVASRDFIGAVDATTGAILPWNAHANGNVKALLVSGSTIYVGGLFNVIGGQTRHGLAALDAGTASATTWDPNVTGTVSALALNGSTVYAGGNFSAVGGQGRPSVAAIDVTSGAPTSWNPKANHAVAAIGVSGSTVYVGGSFTILGGQPRSNLAALDAASGVATSWAPDPDASVFTVAVNGATVYAGGTFTTIGGATRSAIGAVDAASGLATAWDPSAGGAFPVVQALAVSGSTVYAGGYFTSIGGAGRNRIAALDATSGLATSWDPNADGVVVTLAVSGSQVYAGGTFTTIGGQTRDRIAALDATTGSATTWDPNADGQVSAIAVGTGVVYAGGMFGTIGGQPRFYIAALDAVTGSATAWDPSADYFVNTLALGGNVVYAGGSFTAIGGATRLNLASLDPTTGVATAWDPEVSGSVNALAIASNTITVGGDFQAVGVVPAGNVASLATALTIGAVQPIVGGSGGSVTLTLSGSDFQPGAVPKLSGIGPPITGSGVHVSADGLEITASFDLTGAPAGARDVTVTNPDAQTAILPAAFTVQATVAPHLSVDLLGPSRARASRLASFDVVIRNAGNVDAVAVPVWLTGIPAGATVQLDFSPSPAPQDPGEPDWSQVPFTETNGGMQYVSMVIPRVPPGFTVVRVSIAATVGFTLGAAVTPPWADALVFRACLHDAGIVANNVCAATHLTVINQTLAALSAPQPVSGPAVWSKIAWECEGAGTSGAAQSKAAQILNYFEQPLLGNAVASSCVNVLSARWQAALRETIVTSVDPNLKLGPTSKGISSSQTIPYTIEFANQETATADAQEVLVSDGLDATKLDAAHATLGPITFGHDPATGRPYRVDPGPGATRYATSVDLRPARNVIVQILASIDAAAHQANWSFESLDPATGQPPALLGFLPPDGTQQQGEGSVLIYVPPRTDLANGTAIGNQATISFDGTSTTTPLWVNTVDTQPPASQVAPLPAGEDSSTFTVHWQRVNSPDLKDFTVYVSKDNASPQPWRINTTATADTFQSQRGHGYAFMSQGRDSSNNIEPVHTSSDAQTLAPTGVDIAPRLELALDGARPNPAFGVVVAEFTLPSRSPATLDLIDLGGRRVLRRDVTALGPGRHALALEPPRRLRPGMYFMRLTQNGRTLTARVALVR